jgi:hypothetical protein
MDPVNVLPVPGDRVVCGLRFYLPKEDRGHDWNSLGIDTRHSGEFGAFVDMEIFACVECGRDKQKTIRVPRVTVDEAALNELIDLAKLARQFVGDEYRSGEVMRQFPECVEALHPKQVKQ